VTPYPQDAGFWNAFPTNGPMWSLWAELASNVVWFVALKFGRRFTAALFGLSLVVFLIAVFRHGTFDVGWESGIRSMAKALIRALAWFGVGYFIAVRKPPPVVPAWCWAALSAALCALYETHKVDDMLVDTLIVLSGSGLLLSLMTIEPSGAALQKLCAYLGKLSYPLYLSHVPAGRIALWLWGMGMNITVAHLSAIFGVAVLATLMSERIIRSLPSTLRRREAVVS
jgi:peptidoglycan/LPS O-acetylase OafA/YrhL